MEEIKQQIKNAQDINDKYELVRQFMFDEFCLKHRNTLVGEHPKIFEAMIALSDSDKCGSYLPPVIKMDPPLGYKIGFDYDNEKRVVLTAFFELDDEENVVQIYIPMKRFICSTGSTGSPSSPNASDSSSSTGSSNDCRSDIIEYYQRHVVTTAVLYMRLDQAANAYDPDKKFLKMRRLRAMLPFYKELDWKQYGLEFHTRFILPDYFTICDAKLAAEVADTFDDMYNDNEVEGQ